MLRRKRNYSYFPKFLVEKMTIQKIVLVAPAFYLLDMNWVPKPKQADQG
jgi:hypothetical protein